MRHALREGWIIRCSDWRLYFAGKVQLESCILCQKRVGPAVTVSWDWSSLRPLPEPDDGA